MHVVSALRRAPPGRSYFSRFSSLTSASGRVLVVARHEPETPTSEDPFSFYCNFRDPVDWPKVLKEKLGLRRLPKVLSVVDSLGDESDPGVATTFTVTFDATKVEACDAELDKHVRMSNAQLRDVKKAMEKDAKTYYADVKAYKTRIATLEKDLKDSGASCEALEHERKLDELGEFAVKYRKFIVGFEQSASLAPSSGKKATYGKSKVKKPGSNGHTWTSGWTSWSLYWPCCSQPCSSSCGWDSAVSRRNSRAHVPYCYGNLCATIDALKPNDFADCPDAKSVFQEGLETFERHASDAQKNIPISIN